MSVLPSCKPSAAYIKLLYTASRFVNSIKRSGIHDQLIRRTTRSNDEFTSAIRTHIAQYRFGTPDAEGALERTNPRLGRFRRQIFIAALTIRTQLQHFLFLMFYRFFLNETDFGWCVSCSICSMLPGASIRHNQVFSFSARIPRAE